MYYICCSNISFVLLCLLVSISGAIPSTIIEPVSQAIALYLTKEKFPRAAVFTKVFFLLVFFIFKICTSFLLGYNRVLEMV